MRTFRVSLLTTVILSSLAVLQGSGPNDWPAFGNDPGGTKYSPLTEITPANVTRLSIAWTYDTGEKGGGFRGYQQFRAFDSGTGKELWSATLPNDAIATPLTYMGRNGKQYVAIVAGGGLDNFVRPPLEAPRPNVLVAFTLP